MGSSHNMHKKFLPSCIPGTVPLQAVLAEDLLMIREAGSQGLPNPSPDPTRRNTESRGAARDEDTSPSVRGASLAWLKSLAACARKAGVPADSTTAHVVREGAFSAWGDQGGPPAARLRNWLDLWSDICVNAEHR